MIEELRQALYTRLTLGTPLGSMPVYDYVPRGTEALPPYVFIGETEVEADDTDTSEGAVAVTSLHVFTKYRGAKSLAATMDLVRGLFHHYALAVTGSTVILVTAEHGETQNGQDGETRDGIIRVRCLLDDVTP